jgi:hypothetical protein
VAPASGPIAAEAAWRGAYQASGQPTLSVVVERMKTQAAAFERVQTIRPQPGQLSFHAGPHFVTITGGGNVPNETLNRFAAALEQQMVR